MDEVGTPGTSGDGAGPTGASWIITGRHGDANMYKICLTGAHVLRDHVRNPGRSGPPVLVQRAAGVEERRRGWKRPAGGAVYGMSDFNNTGHVGG